MLASNKTILCNVSSVACKVAGPHGPGLQPMRIPARQRIQESPTHITQGMKRTLGDEIASINQELLDRVFFFFYNSVNCLRQHVANE